MPVGRPFDAFIAVFRAAQSASIRRPARLAAANHWSGPCRGLAENRLSASAPTGDRSAREKIGWNTVLRLPGPKADWMWAVPAAALSCAVPLALLDPFSPTFRITLSAARPLLVA